MALCGEINKREIELIELKERVEKYMEDISRVLEGAPSLQEEIEKLMADPKYADNQAIQAVRSGTRVQELTNHFIVGRPGYFARKSVRDNYNQFVEELVEINPSAWSLHRYAPLNFFNVVPGAVYTGTGIKLLWQGGDALLHAFSPETTMYDPSFLEGASSLLGLFCGAAIGVVNSLRVPGIKNIARMVQTAQTMDEKLGR